MTVANGVQPGGDRAGGSGATGRSRRYLLVLVDRQESRLVHSRPGRLEEHPGPSDPVERQVDTDVEVGSWERRHQEAALRHLRRVAAAVSSEVEGTPVDAVVVGGPPEAVEKLVQLLPAGLSGLAMPWSGLTIRAGRAELTRVVDQVDGRWEERHREAVVDLLRERLGTGRAVGGLEATLDAVADGRVATLVVRPGYRAVGARCPSCGHLGTGDGPCPRCGTATDAVDDVVGEAMERARAQDATVEYCSSARLDELGGIGALERF